MIDAFGIAEQFYRSRLAARRLWGEDDYVEHVRPYCEWIKEEMRLHGVVEAALNGLKLLDEGAAGAGAVMCLLAAAVEVEEGW